MSVCVSEGGGGVSQTSVHLSPRGCVERVRLHRDRDRERERGEQTFDLLLSASASPAAVLSA